jgi:hypothetical protein
MADHPESDALLSAVIPFAQQMLRQHSEFYPFGAHISTDGQVALVQAKGEEEHPKSQEVIDLLYSGMKQHAAGNKIVGAAVCYDARVVPPGAMSKVDAICVELQHRSEGCAKVFLPYSKNWWGSIKYGSLFGVELPASVFDATSPG